MAKAKAKGGLGGQGAGMLQNLIPGDEFEVIPIPTGLLVVQDGFNPRQNFPEEEQAILERSIRNRGVLSPLFVKTGPGEKYTLIEGERRWRIASKIGLERLPCIVMPAEMTDREMRLLAVHASHRKQWEPFEEAALFASLESEGMTVKDMAEETGHTVQYIYDRLKLNKADEQVKIDVAEGSISLGQAKRIVTENPDDPQAQRQAAEAARAKKPERGRPKGAKTQKGKGAKTPPEDGEGKSGGDGAKAAGKGKKGGFTYPESMDEPPRKPTSAGKSQGWGQDHGAPEWTGDEAAGSEASAGNLPPVDVASSEKALLKRLKEFIEALGKLFKKQLPKDPKEFFREQEEQLEAFVAAFDLAIKQRGKSEDVTAWSAKLAQVRAVLDGLRLLATGEVKGDLF